MANEQLQPKEEDAQLDAIFGALADSTRRAILVRLTEGDASVAELARPFDMSQPAISRHLRVLEEAGLISRRRQATSNLSHLEAARLKVATDWLLTYREYWEVSFARLDDLLARLQGHAPPVAEPHADAPAAQRAAVDDSAT